MELEEIIYLLKKYTKTEKLGKNEIDEQDETSTNQEYPTVTKWETGLTRSVANQIDYKAKWKDLYTITRGKGNTLL
jgi:hypothetical protein